MWHKTLKMNKLNIHSFIHSFIALLVFSLLFVGCAKEENTVIQSVNKQIPANKRFQNFIGLLKVGEEAKNGVSIRTNETLSVDETLWGLESSLNVLYAKTDTRYKKSDARTASFSIQLENGSVSVAEIYKAYESMWSEMVLHYDALDWANKEFVLADVKLVSNENNTVIINLMTIIADVLASPSSVTDCDVFSPDDNWKVGGSYNINMGKCDGTHLESCAPMEIEKKVNELYLNEHSLITPPLEPFHIGFMSLETVEGYAHDHINFNQDPNNPDPLREFLLWYGEVPDNGPLPGNGVCIEEDNMEWYYCNMVQIIENETPTGKNFVSLKLWHDNLFPDGYSIGEFRYYTVYGAPIFISDVWPIRPTGVHATLDPKLDYFKMP